MFHGHSFNILEVTEVPEVQKMPGINRVKPPTTAQFLLFSANIISFTLTFFSLQIQIYEKATNL